MCVQLDLEVRLSYVDGIAETVSSLAGLRPRPCGATRREFPLILKSMYYLKLFEVIQLVSISAVEEPGYDSQARRVHLD